MATLGTVLSSRRARVAVAALTGLAVTAGAVFAWAWLMQDRSAVARALIWLDAGVDDRARFESEPIPAGGEVLPLETVTPPDGVLDEVTLPDGSTTALEHLLEETETTSFIVLRDDQVWMESYPAGGGREQPVTSFSVAKSVLSTVVGLAIERGEIGSLDDALTDYVPELLERDERFGQITLRHLVTMSSGLRYEEDGLPWSDDAVTYYSPDLRETALSAEIEEEPGTRWLYNNYNPLLIGLVLERATGRPLPAYVSEVLWTPLGAEADASWSIDSEASGFAKMESGFNARPIDFARFGYLFAHDGRVGDRQVVPEDWVAEATAADTSTDPAEHYQYWWWVDLDHPGRFLARGNKGQFVYVDPATDVVVVRTGVDFGIDDWPGVLADVVDRVNAAAG
ncbi:MAG: serine hydrolase domain-containing protein [Nocardioides sp.]